MPPYYYDWQPMREYTKQIGAVFMEDWVPATDREFHVVGLTQVQAEAMYQSYAWRVRHLFNPSNWSYWARVKIALYFLFKIGS
jgi:hypothetical protein